MLKSENEEREKRDINPERCQQVDSETKNREGGGKLTIFGYDARDAASRSSSSLAIRPFRTSNMLSCSLVISTYISPNTKLPRGLSKQAKILTSTRETRRRGGKQRITSRTSSNRLASFSAKSLSARTTSSLICRI